jgi:DUF4097 and DUF4098 domain-containing protein YvlB
MFPGLKPVMIAIALIGFVIPATRGIAKGHSSVIEQERTVERGSRIVVRNEFGDIRIAGSDRNTVDAVATDLNSSQAVPVSITEGSSGNKRVFTVSPVESGSSVRRKVNILLEVKVPHDVELDPIHIRIGNIGVIDLDGGLSLRTDEGNITVRRVGSPGGGLIDLTTGSGNVHASNINGDVRIVSISSSISVQCVKGDVAARVSSGQIAVSDIGGDVELNASSGSVSFIGAINSESHYRLKTMSGDANMDIPDGVGFTAVLSAYSGQIHTDFQFPQTSQTPSSRTNRRIIGKYGNGSGRIELDSFSGEVFLRKIPASSGTDCRR